VVGTRHHTSYGKQVCEDLVRELAAQHLIIVSGLALGIDGIAHETTLATHGKTIAVLGSGINREGVYPSFHKNLAEKIIDTGGALISEYPPYFLPTHYSFPARNRIIAGLTLGTLVIEAPRESGSLITAKHALDYNREVLSVPHPITSLRGEGCNSLIKLGASLVRSAQDVMEALNLKNVQQLVENRHSIPSSPTEEAIAKILSKEPLHIDAIIKHTRLESHRVNSTLLLMEMKGVVQNIGAMRYVLK
jgi:DNA processing protein